MNRLRVYIFAPPALLGVATVIAAAVAEPFLAMFLALMTVAAITITAFAYPPGAYISDERFDRLFPEDEFSSEGGDA